MLVRRGGLAEPMCIASQRIFVGVVGCRSKPSEYGQPGGTQMLFPRCLAALCPPVSFAMRALRGVL